MAKDFLTDEELNNTQNQSPDFIPDSEADKYFGVQEKEPDTTNSFLQGHSILRGISNFLGTTGPGKGIAQGVFLRFTPEGKDLLNRYSKGEITTQDVENVIGKTSNAKEVIGGAIQMGLNIATLGLAPASGATALARIGKTAAQVGALSAGSGAARTLEKGGDVKDIFKSALLSGAIGAGLGAAFKGIGEGINILTKKTPTRLYNTAIKPTLDESRKAIKYQGKTLGEELIDRGVRGGDKKLLNTAIEELNKNEDKLQEILSKSASTKTVTRKELMGYIDDLITKKKATPGLAEDAEKIRAIVMEFPKSVSLSEANIIKRNLYNALRDVSFKLDPALSTKKEAMKAIASGIKTEIEKEVGGTAVQTLNKNLSVYGRLHDRIVDKLARAERNAIISLGDLPFIGAGALAGAAQGGAFSTIVGATVGEAIKKIGQSTAFKTNAAVVLNQLGNTIEKLPTDTAGKISKIGLINALKELSQ